VVIGTDQSLVAGGEVQREMSPCGEGRLRLSSQQAAQSAAVVLRKFDPTKGPNGGGHVERTVRTGARCFALHETSRFRIERLDEAEAPIDVSISAIDLPHGRFYDFQRMGFALEAGGVYRAETDNASLIFKITPDADTSPKPVL